jgi:TPR repeat protein
MLDPRGRAHSAARLLDGGIMRQLLSGVIAFLVCSLALAGPFEDGAAAYQRQDYAGALRIWQPLAERGNAQAQHNLGILYAQGRGVAKDMAEAVKWHEKAANQGYAPAQTNLAYAYLKGLTVKQSDAEAARWYRRAADQGNADAQNNLGRMYAAGQGVPVDYVQAYMWTELAVSQQTDAKEREVSLRNRDIIAGAMTPEQIAEAQRLARNWKKK